MMKRYPKALKGLALAACAAVTALPAKAQLTPGNIVVLQAGDGVATLVNTGNSVFLQEYLRSGAAQAAPVSTIAIPASGAGRLVISGVAATEGILSLSTDSTRLVFAGYDTSTTNATALNSSASSVIGRVVDTVNSNGAVGRADTTSAFSGNNIRSVVRGMADDYWAVGGNSGVQYLGNTAPATALGTTITNIRTIQAANGNLYFSSAAGANAAIYKIAGMPTTGGTGVGTLLFNIGATGAGNNPLPGDLAVNATETIVYVADARTTGSGGGIQKWVLSSGTWAVADTLLVGSGAKGLAVDWSSTHPQLYTTTNDNRLVMVVDTGYAPGTVNSYVTLATASVNTSFKGVAFTPRPSTPCTAPTLSTTTTNVSCSGNGSVMLTVTGGSPVSSYFWTGANGFTATTQNLTNISAGTYAVTVNASGCTATTSATVSSTATVSASASALGLTTFCSGDSVVLKADTGTGYAFQWYNGTTAITGATDTTYAATTSGSYTVEVSKGGCTATSNAIPVTVGAAVNVTVSAGGATSFCQGDSVMLSATGVSGVSYQWFRNGTPLAGANTASIHVRNNGQYRVYVTNGMCTDTSASTQVTVIPNPNAAIASNTPTSFCFGDSVTLRVPGPAIVPRTFQWIFNGNPLIGSTDSFLTTMGAGSYTVIVTNGGLCADTSAATAVVVNMPPTASVSAASATTFCSGDSVVLMAATTPGDIYQWLIDGMLVAGATDSNYLAMTSGGHSVVVTNTAGCTDTSAAVAVMVNPLPTPTVVFNGTTLDVQNATGYTNFMWYLNGSTTPIAGATAATYTPTVSGVYTVSVDSNGCAGMSSTTTVSLGVSNTAQARLTIAPNPAQTSFEILPAAAYSVRLTDVQGRTVLTAETTSRVDISRLAEGLYLLHIRTQNGGEALPVKLLKK